jgi:bisphosphoglycerate-independent phosphoglycerate mutase (AlkP superfamily)
MSHVNKPLILLTINAWGIRGENEDNAISLAKPNNFYRLIREFPVSAIKDPSKDIIKRYHSLAKGNDPSLTICELIAQSNLKQIFVSNQAYFLESFSAFNRGKLLKNQDLYLVDQLITDPIRQAEEIIKKSKEIIKKNNYQFIYINLPTISQAFMQGNRKYLIKAVSRIDKYLGKISELALEHDYSLVISSLFGQAENLNNLPSQERYYPEINDNPVPLLIIGNDLQATNLGLADPIDNDLSLIAPSGGFEIVKNIILKLIKII